MNIIQGVEYGDIVVDPGSIIIDPSLSSCSRGIFIAEDGMKLGKKYASEAYLMSEESERGPVWGKEEVQFATTERGEEDAA